MNCPHCGHKDLRDLGFIRSSRVFMCRACGRYSEHKEGLTKLTKPMVLKSLR